MKDEITTRFKLPYYILSVVITGFGIWSIVIFATYVAEKPWTVVNLLLGLLDIGIGIYLFDRVRRYDG